MNSRLLVVLLAALVMLTAFSIDTYLPALPTIAQGYGVTLAAAQQTLTAYLIAYAFMSLFWGMLSDSFGRRPIILVSLVIYLLSNVGAAFSPSLGWLLFFRLMQGFSAGAGNIVGRAIIIDLYSGREAQKLMSAVSAVFGMAPAIAPVLGGWLLATLGWPSIFHFISIFTLLLGIACLCWLPETLVPGKRHAFHFSVVLKNYIDVATHARFIFGTLATALTFIGIMLYVASAPAYLLGILHVSVKGFAWLFIPFVAGMTLGSIISGWLSHRLTPSAIIRLGYAFMFAASLFTLVYTELFTPRVPWAVMPHFFFGLGMAIATPPMTILTLEMFPHVKGLPSSLQSFFFFVIFALLSGLIAPLLFGSAFHLALGVMAGLVASLLLWWLASRGLPAHPLITEDEQALAEEAPHL
jgi:DHA1 family bicyclomycin/chloramphenicol resistance-like MFS transporter